VLSSLCRYPTCNRRWC